MTENLSSDSPLLLVDQPKPGIVRICMNRPQSFNALSSEMMQALQNQLELIKSDPSCRVVVLSSKGRAFSSGHDLKEMCSQPNRDFYEQLFAQCSRLMMSLQSLPQPVVAQVDGIATAAGCQLVAMCDLAVATQSSRFAVSGIHYGLFCATPSVGLTRNVSRKMAMEMLLTGDFISADQALERGLINRSVTSDSLTEVVIELCMKIIEKPAVAIEMGKALFYQQAEMGMVGAYQLAGQVMACNMMDPAAQEGFQAFLEKRPPSWKPNLSGLD
jgi:enoyl-CoA hydratase/carnithine racemase